MINNFVPNTSWLSFEYTHKAHVYCIEICKIIIEYGLLNENEFDQIINKLYNKI